MPEQKRLDLTEEIAALSRALEYPLAQVMRRSDVRRLERALRTLKQKSE